MWFGVVPRTDIKRDVFIRDWTVCLEYDNHSRLHSQHNLGNLYDLLMRMRIVALIMNKIFI